MRNTVILLRPDERQSAIRMLDLLGVRFKWNVDVKTIAGHIARVLHCPLPKDMADQQAMIRAFVKCPPPVVMVPMQPLVVGEPMLRALYRAAHPYDRVPGDGR